MAGGGIKVNNITVSGGADGLTPVFKIEGGILFYSYNNGEKGSWYELGQVKGADGTNGKDGKTGAKLISQELIGQDANGGNIYKQTFDDGTIAYFTAPKGEKGDKGDKGDAGEGGGTTTDVQINGTSITKNGVANIPIASTSKLGVINTVDIEKNKTNIKILYAGLKQKNIIIPSTIENNSITRQTAEGLPVVDGSIATVKKIEGNTVKVNGGLKNAKISGVKSIGENFVLQFNKRTVKTYNPSNVSDNDIYKGLLYSGTQVESVITNITTTENSITFIPTAAKAYGVGIPIRVYGEGTMGLRYKSDNSVWRGYIVLDETGQELAKNVAVDNPNNNGVVSTHITIPTNAKWLIIILNQNYETLPNKAITFSDLSVSHKDLTEYKPYTESVMTLPQTVELGKWDYVENGKKVVQTIIETFNNSKYDETAATYNGTTDFILSEDNMKVAYKGTAMITELSFDNNYSVWDKGTEQMQLENSESVPTITAEYLILGGIE